MRLLVALTCIAMSAPARADVIVSTRVIRPHEIIGPGDLLLREGDRVGDVSLDALIGKEARIAIYPGRPISVSHVGPPAVIERNQIVPLTYARAGVEIVTEGRSLTRAGIGDYVRVMNLSSRSTVSGRVSATGRVMVTP